MLQVFLACMLLLNGMSTAYWLWTLAHPTVHTLTGVVSIPMWKSRSVTATSLHWVNSRSKFFFVISRKCFWKGLEMAYSVILHMPGEPSILGEVEDLPKPSDNLITVSNPRLRDGKDIHYLEHNVVKVIWPVNKLTLIEVLESEEEEHLIGFVRE